MARFTFLIASLFFYLSIFGRSVSLEDIFSKAIFYPNIIDSRPMADPDYFTYLDQYQRIVKRSYIDSSYVNILIDLNKLDREGVEYIWDY